MATATFQPPPTNSQLYLNPRTEPSPPEEYLYGKGVNKADSPIGNTSPNHTSSSAEMWHGTVADIKPRRKALGLPAALRPADYNPTLPANIPTVPKAPDTPLATKDNSFDSNKSYPLIPTKSIDYAFANNAGSPNLNDLSISRSQSHRWDLGQVTGPPTKAHWKLDADSKDCAVCHVNFTCFTRRHHCRRCGRVVCYYDLNHKVRLNQNADFHPAGQQSWSCKACYEDWKEFNDQYQLQYVASFDAPQGDVVATKRTLKPTPPATALAREGPIPESGMYWSTF